MTAIPTPRPVLWSGYEWIDRMRPESRMLTGDAYAIAKRLLDVVLVLLAMPLWVVAWGMCALAIKIDDPSAPVLFTQRRTGIGGKTIVMHKFRTMVPDAEAMKWELRHLNELEWPDFKITNDPRITRPGGFLRKTSLDELPQLWDVLMGRLSLVGPRPTDFMADTYRLWQTERLDVKPGITGLWQIYGRGLAEFDDRTRLDIAYVQRRSIWFDFQILFRTIPAVLTRRGAK
jgi:lipopolysaccharide/colanic/teichoic acid biosynthesis glycosyltransferase